MLVAVTRTRTVRLVALLVALATAPGLAASAAATRSAGNSKPGTKGTPKARSVPAKPSSSAKARYSRSRAEARRRQLARARASRLAREARLVQTPQFRLDENGEQVPDVRAAAGVIYNPATREVLWQENAHDERSIASITKVMTAIVFLENEFDLEREVVVDPQDARAASTTYLRANERLSVGQMLHLMLIASDNAAARTAARNSPYGPAGFIVRMNEKATELGLEQTRYADPSGLDNGNVSSALDMARLIAYAASDDRISRIMQKPEHTVVTSRRTITIHNTNRLVRQQELPVLGGKTGFIRSSGYCLATLLRLPQTNEEVAVVILGARSNAGRFMETKHLFNWINAKAQALGLSTSRQDIQNDQLQPE